MGIYDHVQYYLMQGNESDETKQLLKAGGGKREFYLSDMVTHVISSSSSPQFVTSIGDMNAAVVTEEWVRLSSQCDELLPCEPFSLLPNRLFSGVVACSSQVSVVDRNRLWAMLTYYGGQVKLQLDSKCTHLLVPQPVGAKFARACKFQEKIRIVTPDWVRDCAAQKKLLPEADYFPVREEDRSSETRAEPTKASPVSEERASPTSEEGEAVTQGDMNIERSSSPAANLVENHPKASPPPTISTASTVTILSERSPPLLDPRFASNEDTIVSLQPQLQLRSAHIIYATPDKPRPSNPPDVSCQRDATIASPPHMHCTRSQPRNYPHVESQKPERIAEQRGQSVHSETHSQNGRRRASDPGDECRTQCLAGCVFVFTDYQECMEEGTLDGWKRIVEQHGGHVDEVYFHQQCTHLLAMNQCSALCQQAIQDGKKVVAAHWLNDVLEQQRVFPPCKVLHLPTPYQDTLPGCINMVISLTGYLALERHLVKDMILLTGAKFTSSLSRENTHLICKCPDDSLKFSKAQQWGVVIVNARWLADILTTGEIPKHSLPQYQCFGLPDELLLRPECVQHLLAPWRTPALSIPQKRISVPAAVEGVHPLPPSKFSKRSSEDLPRTPQILLTGLVTAVSNRLTQLLHKIGGMRAMSAKSCTHLVAPRVARTVKFLSAVSTALYIVTPDWIEDSFHKGHFLDEQQYLLRDSVSEEQLQFSMDLMMRRRAAQKHGILHGVLVYCTPNVEPPVNGIRSIVECAGGEVIECLPSRKQLLQLIKSSSPNCPRLIVLSCLQDLRLCTSLFRLKVGVYATELVMSGVLQQKIDYKHSIEKTRLLTELHKEEQEEKLRYKFHLQPEDAL